MSRRGNSGQILLVAAFIMASLLVSAQLYILDVGKITSETTAYSLGDFVAATQLGSRHIAIGSLANISNGGWIGTFAENLQRWSAIVGKQYQAGKSFLNFSVQTTAPYSSGIWIDWGANGAGSSSAYVSFTHRISGREVDVQQSFFMNITTMLLIQSHYRNITGDLKQINITISLLNEAEPALARRITTYYRIADAWEMVDDSHNCTVFDYGNGTYHASFAADIPSQTVEVSVHVVDQRGIYVQANATSLQV